MPPADQSDERGWQSVNVNVVLYVHILSLDTKLHHNASNNNNIKMHGYHQLPMSRYNKKLIDSDLGDILQGHCLAN